MKITFCRCFYGGVFSCTDCGGSGIIIDNDAPDEIVDQNQPVYDPANTYLRKLNIILDNIHSDRYVDLKKIKDIISNLHRIKIKQPSIYGSPVYSQIELVYLQIIDAQVIRNNPLANNYANSRDYNSNNPIFKGAILFEMMIDEFDEFYFIDLKKKTKSEYFKIKIVNQGICETLKIHVSSIISILNGLNMDIHPYNLHANEIKQLSESDVIYHGQILTGHLYNLNDRLYEYFYIYLNQISEHENNRYEMKVSDFHTYALTLIN